MAVRSLEQIYGELGNIYDPQANLIRQRQAEIPGQIQAEEKGLQAKQEQAFGDILGGARRRGLGFSGIPLQEQARYTSTEFLPALARLKQSGREKALSLEEAILGIQERRNQQAQGIRTSEFQQDLAERQFAEGVRQFNEQLKASAAERARAASSYSPSFGGAPSVASASTKADPGQQKAYNDVRTRVGSQNDEQLRSDYVATATSAKYGNPIDQFKLQLYRQLRPDLFKFKYSWEK